MQNFSHRSRRTHHNGRTKKHALGSREDSLSGRAFQEAKRWRSRAEQRREEKKRAGENTPTSGECKPPPSGYTETRGQQKRLPIFGSPLSWFCPVLSCPVLSCSVSCVCPLAETAPPVAEEAAVSVSFGPALPRERGGDALRAGCFPENGKPRKSLKKDLSLSPGPGRIRLREAPCGTGVAFFSGYPGVFSACPPRRAAW
jgi:hypothetical protein